MTAIDGLQPGDIVILPDPLGHWSSSYVYVRPDEEAPGRVIVRDPNLDVGKYSVLASAIIRPTVTGAGSEPEAPTATRRKAKSADLLSDAQRRRLFARARAVGLSTDDLRAATPKGSISTLTRAEASDLIDRLQGRRPKAGSTWSDQGSATGRQLGMIAHLRDLIGFTEADFADWMSKRFKVGLISQIRDARLASRIIGGLVKMQTNRATGKPAGRSRRASNSV